MLKHLASDCCCSVMTSSPARIQCWSIGPQKRSLCPCPSENQHKQLPFKDLFEVLFLKIPEFCVQMGHLLAPAPLWVLFVTVNWC